MKPSISWLRVFVEGVVIVGSILLAFGIDAWWEGRQERLEEREILLSLQEEFTRQRGTLSNMAAAWERNASSSDRLLQAIDSGRVPPVAVMDSLLRWSLAGTTFDPGSGARDALIASGRLELIRSSDLRFRLAAWQGVVDEVRDNEQAMREFLLGVTMPYLARAGLAFSRIAVLTPDRWTADVASESEAALVYGRLLEDPEFEGLTAIRRWWIDLDEYRSALEFVDGILERIDAELSEAEEPPR